MWISTSVWEHVQAEVAFLRAELSRKHEHERRLERKELGLPELAPERKEPDLPPIELVELIEGYADERTRSSLRAEVAQMRGQGQSWDVILNKLAEDVEG